MLQHVIIYYDILGRGPRRERRIRSFACCAENARLLPMSEDYLLRRLAATDCSDVALHKLNG